tara:strand:- start:159 stop:530 length:372 start_codon:yes stop_codon:yes gene_type:complete
MYMPELNKWECLSCDKKFTDKDLNETEYKKCYECLSCDHTFKSPYLKDQGIYECPKCHSRNVDIFDDDDNSLKTKCPHCYSINVNPINKSDISLSRSASIEKEIMNMEKEYYEKYYGIDFDDD